ncbi:MAG: hypothetical protein D6759_03260 [Chloroflexi bacterium]|nr:MAG: hypothetical protein D6759_03260 [Chloroflexota bacterium]
MSSQEKPITMNQAIDQVAAQLDGPTPMDEFIRRVLELWPSKAKNPAASIRQRLRYGDAPLVTLPDRKTVIPVALALKGVRFRIPLSRQEARRGFLLIYPNFDIFLNQHLRPEAARLFDKQGHPLPTQVIQVRQGHLESLGPYKVPAFRLTDWFHKRRVRRGDSILVTVEDWQQGHFRLEHEPARKRRQHQEEIARKNREMADLFFDILEAAYYEEIFTQQAVPTVYALMSDPRGYPGDHWIQVVEQDPRMRWTGGAITYSDRFSPLERMLFGQTPVPQEVNCPPELARKVYRFKAALRYRPGLWRRIEIQGEQTLADFDAILRQAFEHDTLDHLGGFWKRARRGKSKRFRKVDLGTVDPFGEGEGADLPIGGLGLQPGDQLEYVYDFGDWIEHLLTLEEIADPEPGADYPQIVGRNRPRYRYCETCKAEGRKTVATWICLECSNAEQREVLICEDCLLANHETHYAGSILY